MIMYVGIVHTPWFSLTCSIAVIPGRKQDRNSDVYRMVKEHTFQPIELAEEKKKRLFLCRPVVYDIIRTKLQGSK